MFMNKTWRQLRTASHRIAFAVSAGLACFTLSTPLQAQDFPSRPIKIVLPSGPGNAADIFSRFFAEKLSGIVKQPVIIENKPGANNQIAVEAVKAAPADGYTVMLATSASAIGNILFKRMPYDLERDFRWISGQAQGAPMLLVSANSPYGSVSDLVAAAKAKPDALNYGWYAAPYRLASEWLNQDAGIKIVNVPYKGAVQAATDLIGGQITYTLIDASAALPFIQAGKLRALAYLGAERNSLMPQIPTMRESGFPDFVFTTWLAFAVRAQTPDNVSKALSDAMAKILAMKETHDFAARQGTPLLTLGAAEMKKFATQEDIKYRRIATVANIQPE